jgi:flagellar motor switch protein FliG
MKPPLTPLRKAAILLSTLDDQSALALLSRMEPHDALRVREEIDDLDDVDPALAREIVAEFRRQETQVRDPYPSGIELDSSLAQKLAQPEPPTAQALPHSVEEPPPFQFLHAAEADALVEHLERERPQTIAVVISHLAPVQAAQVLDRLPSILQAQVLRRLAELDETDPSALRDIERHLESQITEHIRSRQRRQAGMQALGAILSAAEGKTRRGIVASVMRHDAGLAEKLGFQTSSPAKSVSARPSGNAEGLEFSDVLKMSRPRLRALLEAAEMEIVVLALAGTSGEFVERAAGCLPPQGAALLKHALVHVGPARLSDVEEAQQALADLAAELASANTRSARLASAA